MVRPAATGAGGDAGAEEGATGGAKLEDVVSVLVHLSDPDLRTAFNNAYKELMPTPYPTRTAVGASLRGFLVEITAVAYLGS